MCSCLCVWRSAYMDEECCIWCKNQFTGCLLQLLAMGAYACLCVCEMEKEGLDRVWSRVRVFVWTAAICWQWLNKRKIHICCTVAIVKFSFVRSDINCVTTRSLTQWKWKGRKVEMQRLHWKKKKTRKWVLLTLNLSQERMICNLIFMCTIECTTNWPPQHTRMPVSNRKMWNRFFDLTRRKVLGDCVQTTTRPVWISISFFGLEHIWTSTAHN